MKTTWIWIPLLIALAVPGLPGCATTTKGARPEDMSATKHRAHTRHHQKEAGHHAKQYDPNQEHVFVNPTGGVSTADGTYADFDVWPDTVYNPTDVHLGHAAEHQEHARQHAAAAAALENYEKKTCKRFNKKTRVVCPLLGQVGRMENLPQGARLVLKPDVNAQAVLEHIRCHHAYGQTIGREGMNACPLYLKGLRIALSPEKKAVDITTTDATAVAPLRKRAQAHVVP